MSGDEWVKRSVRRLAERARAGSHPTAPELELINAWEDQVITYIDYLSTGTRPDGFRYQAVLRYARELPATMAIEQADNIYRDLQDARGKA